MSPTPGPTHAPRLGVIERLAEYDLYFMETPIDIDDLDGYAFLHRALADADCCRRMAEHAFEFLDLADRGQLDVLQPDIGRVGGFTEASRVRYAAAAVA